jgi:prepilin-type N-terminal cleavage/methylation domain-containing protein
MKKKGFTLIELLATIVILAVIAIIVTPMIMSTINGAKKGTLKASAANLLSAAENTEGIALVKSINLEYPITFTFTGDTVSVTPSSSINMEFKGNDSIKGGAIKIYADGKSELAVSDGTYCAYKSTTDDDIKVLTDTMTTAACQSKITGILEKGTITIKPTLHGKVRIVTSVGSVDSNSTTDVSIDYTTEGPIKVTFIPDSGYILSTYSAEFMTGNKDANVEYTITGYALRKPVMTAEFAVNEVVADKIKDGETINGITGTYTSDGTATAADILSGKMAYSKATRLVGTMTSHDAITNAVSASQNGTNAYIRIPQGAYLTNATSGYPEISVPITTIDSDIVAGNIKSGVTIGGVTGTMQSVTPGFPAGYAFKTGSLALSSLDGDKYIPLTALFTKISNHDWNGSGRTDYIYDNAGTGYINLLATNYGTGSAGNVALDLMYYNGYNFDKLKAIRSFNGPGWTYLDGSVTIVNWLEKQ